MKKLIFNTFVFSLVMVCAGCSTDSLLNGSESSENNKFSQDDYFDFSTTENITFAVDYGSRFGGRTLMEVFTEDPTGTTDEEAIRSDIEPVYKGYTDANGKFEGDVILPTYVEKVWLVNRAFCMPMIVEANVNNGYVEYENNTNVASASSAKGIVTRSSESELSYQVEKVYQASGDAGYYLITQIEDRYGSVHNSALVSNNTTFGGADYTSYIKSLQKILWGADTKGSVDNTKYALGSEKINTVIKSSYIDDNGVTHNVESADLSIVLMTESGNYESALGYYYYPTPAEGESAPAAKDVKKFIALPNTSVANGNGPYGIKDNTAGRLYDASLAPAYAGESVSLLFEKADGTFTKHFPAGYTVGFFLLRNGYDSQENATQRLWVESGHATCSNGKRKSLGPVFSNEAWNSDGISKFIAFSLPTGEIVYGMEDGADKSCEDNLYLVKGTPNEVIENTALPTIDIAEEKITQSSIDKKYRTYAFEDKFPYSKGCDYDMNDVIVGHQRNIEFDENDNLKTVTDAFEFKQKKDALDYKDGFAIQLNPSCLGSIKITDGDGNDITSSVKSYADTRHSNWKTYVICEDAKANTGKTFTVTRTFSGSCTKTAFEAAEPIGKINPFVISQLTNSAYENNMLTEVHFAGEDPMTSKGNPEYLQGGDEYYLGLTGDNQYFPYALSLPVSQFDAPDPGVRIDVVYTGFQSWANSKGKENKDWYTSKQ